MAGSSKTAKASPKDYGVMLKEAGALIAITLVAGLLLGFVYELTKQPREYQQQLAINRACSEVMPDATSFKEIEYEPGRDVLADLSENSVRIGTVYEAYTSSNEFKGYVIETTSSEGYGGDIVLYIGVDPFETPSVLKGVSILSISETAGLGMRAGEVLVPQFAEKQEETFVYTKTGKTESNEIDAISGATITTKAFVNAVNGGLEAASEIFEKAIAEGRVTADETE